jgi:DNA-binding response OmpR family regulator
MPQMGGRELAERLRAVRPGLDVLFMSGYTDDTVVRLGVREAEVNFLQKPFSPAELARRVRMVLDAVG